MTRFRPTLGWTWVVTGVLAAVALVTVGLPALAWELWSYSYDATFSEALRVLWAHQPWVVFLATHLAAAVWWFLCGHWFGAPKSHYDALRAQGERQRERAGELLRAWQWNDHPWRCGCVRCELLRERTEAWQALEKGGAS